MVQQPASWLALLEEEGVAIWVQDSLPVLLYCGRLAVSALIDLQVAYFSKFLEFCLVSDVRLFRYAYVLATCLSIDRGMWRDRPSVRHLQQLRTRGPAPVLGSLCT